MKLVLWMVLAFICLGLGLTAIQEMLPRASGWSILVWFVLGLGLVGVGALFVALAYSSIDPVGSRIPSEFLIPTGFHA